MLGSLGVTGIIVIFHLYPRIPNISIIYLLVVLTFAVTCGRYAAIVTSLIASLAFDFFVVPPFFTFVMYDPSEWVALFIFLVVALVTAQLASSLRVQVQSTVLQEHETHALYDLIRETTRPEALQKPSQVIVQAIVKVFAARGVRDCLLLQPDEQGRLQVQASARQALLDVQIAESELMLAHKVLLQEQRLCWLETGESTKKSGTHRLYDPFIGRHSERICPSICWLPLRLGEQIIGVIRLQIQSSARSKPLEDLLRADPQTGNPFFWTFLDQAASLIERARLQSENLSIEILQRTDALRSTLLSSVSHDLRTPLTVIKAAATSLLQEEIEWGEQERRSFILSIEKEADRLNHLVGNLLDMSRIEHGAIQPDKDWYNINALIADVVTRLQPLLKEREVHLFLPEEISLVELDYLHIDQVVSNLLENAVRYTPPDSPIDVRVEDQKQMIQITVADRGPGIALEDLEHIFDKFYRVLTPRPEQQNEEQSTGSGLGLAVCKGLVEAHHGRIWAEPRPGGGVIFFVTLPTGTFDPDTL
ncbi:hypothetical protein KTT_35330 [Tengunoibacter tsumagoiensis]|uniref:histidine kinase n=2 Tax=Tengunoibacter tsumagoiensis TaxID=2014871 RepID=A0A402A3F9_9CHLR|nr:hypothetical protein KTT_35330 [Tengunoibacter tsumagoiensis]